MPCFNVSLDFLGTALAVVVAAAVEVITDNVLFAVTFDNSCCCFCCCHVLLPVRSGDGLQAAFI